MPAHPTTRTTLIPRVNNGDEHHMGQLIRLEGGRTLDDSLVAYNEAFRATGPCPTRAQTHSRAAGAVQHRRFVRTLQAMELPLGRASVLPLVPAWVLALLGSAVALTLVLAW